MSYVCLSSPSWSTGEAPAVDFITSLLEHAPRIAVGERQLIWGDARGLNGAKLAEAMVRVASDYGHDDVHAGVALTPVAAEVASTQSNAPLVCVKPGTDASFIAPYPLRVLSPSEHIAALLNGLGIETCGAFGSLDAESIEVRLGIEGVRLWQRARAEDARWLFKIPLRALPSASVEWVEYGLKDPERLQFVINSLANTVCASLQSRGERAREMGLVFSLGNRTQRTHVIRSSRPSAEQKRWMRLVREALDSITLPDAVMGVTLRVESVVGHHGAQGDLFDRGFASEPAVQAAVTQLTDDQGDIVVEPVNDEHPLLELRTKWVRKGRRDERVGMSEKRRMVRHNAAQRLLLSPSSPSSPSSLTLQLLPTPKVITVETNSRRDHVIPTRYLDGNEWHVISEAAGPDRVSGGEWSVEYAREYFRCVREDGMMVWLYHDTQQQTKDWFLHGWWD